MISPFAKENYVDHRITDQSSILRFIEDNWDLGRIGGGSPDVKAGTLTGFFDFGEARRIRLLLDPQTGSGNFQSLSRFVSGKKKRAASCRPF